MPKMFDGYLSVVKDTIHNKRLHDPICLELEGHLQDKADFYVEIGYDELTAQRKALEEMGDPRLVAEKLGKIHNLSVKQYLVLVVYHIALFINLIMKLGLFDFFGDNANYSLVWFKHFSAFAVLMFWGVWLSLSYRRKTPAVTSVITLISGVPCVWWFSSVLTHLATGNLQYFSSKMLLADKLWFDFNVPCVLSAAVSVLIYAFSISAVVMAIRYNNSAFMSDRKIKKTVCVVFLLLILTFTGTFAVTYREVERQETAHAEVFTDLRMRFIDFIKNDGNGVEVDVDVEKILSCFNDVEFTQQTRVNDGQKITELKGQKGVGVLEFSVHEDKSFGADIYFDEDTFSSANILGFFSKKSTFNHKSYLLMDSDTFNALVDNFELISRTDTIADSIEMFRSINYLNIQYSFNAEENYRAFHTRTYGPETLLFGTNDFYLTEQDGKIIQKDSILD